MIGLALFGAGLLVLYVMIVSFSSVEPLVTATNDLLAPTPKPALPASVAPLTGFPLQLQGKLISMDGGQERDVDAKTLRGIKYWAFYYSASWCPPCRAFTPYLVNFYRDFKPSHPNFELILVNADQSESDMLQYMRNDAMPWPAVTFSELQNVGVRKFAGSGIPDLVLVDARGNVLSDSFGMFGNYIGPLHVIEDIRSKVQ